MLKILRIAGVLLGAVLIIWPLSGCDQEQADRFFDTAGSAPESIAESLADNSGTLEDLPDSVPENLPDSMPEDALESLPEQDPEENETQSQPQNSTDTDSSANPSKKPDRLPLENMDYQAAELKNYETNGAQFFLDEPKYYRIANTIYHYRDYHNTLIFNRNFEDIQQADSAWLVEIAASQAPRIDLYSAAFRNLSSDTPIGQFVAQKKQCGAAIGLLAYGDMVRAEAKTLFGKTYELPRTNGKTIRYDKGIDAYYLDCEGASLSTDYPVIVEELNSQEDDNTIAVKAITLCYWDFNGTWSSPDGSWESKGMSSEDIKQYVIQQIEAGNKQFIPSTYYLQETDGSLRVTGYQKG